MYFLNMNFCSNMHRFTVFNIKKVLPWFWCYSANNCQKKYRNLWNFVHSKQDILKIMTSKLEKIGRWTSQTWGRWERCKWGQICVRSSGNISFFTLVESKMGIKQLSPLKTYMYELILETFHISRVIDVKSGASLSNWESWDLWVKALGLEL